MYAGAFWVAFALYKAFPIHYLPIAWRDKQKSYGHYPLKSLKSLSLSSWFFSSALHTSLLLHPLQNKDLIWCHQKNMGDNGNTLGAHLGTSLCLLHGLKQWVPRNPNVSRKHMLGERTTEALVVARRELVSLRPCKIAWRWDNRGSQGVTHHDWPDCLAINAYLWPSV